MIELTRGIGLNSAMSEAWPNITTPSPSSAAIGAVESVCCMITSAPWSISCWAASASLAGSNQVFTQTILNSTSGFTALAAR